MNYARLIATISAFSISIPALSAAFSWPIIDPPASDAINNYYARYDYVVDNEYHTGIDIVSTSSNTDVRAAGAGTVRLRDCGLCLHYADNHGMGNVVIIDHNEGKGPFSLYAHLDSIVGTLSEGSPVTAGEKIGVMGNTGCNNDPNDPCGVHLHFETKQWGVLGSVDDDAGPGCSNVSPVKNCNDWGYTPLHPNLHGYMNPIPYLESNLPFIEPRTVASQTAKDVKTGPGIGYNQVITTVQAGQKFVAFSALGEWYQVHLPGDTGPASGWIEAAPITSTSRLQIDNSERRVEGVRVRTEPSIATGKIISHVRDKQYFSYADQAAPTPPACFEPWYRTYLSDNAEVAYGWVCGELVNVLLPYEEAAAHSRQNKNLIIAADKASSPPLTFQALNDTGITLGGEALDGNNAACAGAAFPQQDCSHGRDATHYDDSDGHAGFSFTKLSSAGAELAAGAGSWSCVRDNVTGLTWEVKTNDGGIHDKDNTYRWGGIGADNYGTEFYDDWDALVYGSNDTTLCGYSDWRMSAISELESLVNLGRVDPAIDTEYFPNTTSSQYWSTSINGYSGYADRAFFVDFHKGGSGNYNLRRSDGGHARVVRGGQSSTSSPRAVCKPDVPASTPNSRLDDNGDGTITDKATGLMWKQCSEGQDDIRCSGSATAYDWQKALLIPQALNLSGGYAGHTDWRLPNIKELRSIVENACSGPSINSNRFPNTPSRDFWSASPVSYDPGRAWYLYFGNSYFSIAGRHFEHHVRLVRSAQ